MRKISVLGITNHRFADVRGWGGRRVRPLDPLVCRIKVFAYQYMNCFICL